MYANTAAQYIKAWCAATFNDADRMESTMANGGMIDAFDHVGGGSHKYIPVEKLNEDLGLRQGAGVFNYWKMKDGSYLLRTCDGPLAVWYGGEEKAFWPKLRAEKI